MKSVVVKAGLRSIGRISGRVVMLLFCGVLAMAVFVESLRQHLSRGYVFGVAHATGKGADTQRAEPFRLAVAAAAASLREPGARQERLA